MNWLGCWLSVLVMLTETLSVGHSGSIAVKLLSRFRKRI